MFPSASQAVPPGQRGRVLGDVESVVSGVSPLVQTKLLFTSHWIIMEHDQETIVAMTFLYFENDLK